MAEVFFVLLVFGTGITGIIAFSPIGRAIGERLRPPQPPQALPAEDLDDIRSQLQHIEQQVSELAERQDFSERLLAQVRERGQLGPAKDAS